MPETMQAGDVLAGRYRLDDLLAESRGGRFWRAHDTVLHRPVAVHIIPRDDERAEGLIKAARLVGPISDRRVLRVLDAEIADTACYVVNEWCQGDSLDNLLYRDGPLPPRRIAWLVSEVAEAVAAAHDVDVAHGRLVPENVMIDHHGQVRIVGFAVDAALLGLPPGRKSADVTDLVALLYCGLTGKWPGVSTSLMPAAPLDHGHVLRPRRVRAGIPRTLDALCDQVLNPVGQRSEQDVTTARDLHELLTAFIGDPGPGLGAAQGTSPSNTVELPTSEVPTEAPPADDPAPSQEQVPAPEETPAEEGVPEGPTAVIASAPSTSTELPTQAGMPVFHDDSEDVEWLRARAEVPPPPPPLADIPEKPLFAPDPPEGQPVRRPRPGSRAASASTGYWPWESSEVGESAAAANGTWHTGAANPGSTHTGSTHTGSWGTGSWNTGSWGTGEGFEETDDRVPGRSWIRLAMIVGLCALVLVAAVAAYQLGVGRPEAETPPASTSTPSAVDTAPQPFTDLTAEDFDPQGSPAEENPDQVAAVLDDDPATTWTTQTYRQNFGPGGLKTGVGLVIDLGATKGVREVAVATAGGDTAVAAYVTGARPTGVAQLTPVGTALGSDVLTITLDEAVSGRYVTIWLTSLPAVSGGFKGTIQGVEVRG